MTYCAHATITVLGLAWKENGTHVELPMAAEVLEAHP